MTPSPAFLTALMSSTFECSSAGWMTAIVWWSLCEAMTSVVGTAATVSTVTAVTEMIRPLIHVLRKINITGNLLWDRFPAKDEPPAREGHRVLGCLCAGLYGAENS